MVLVCRNGVVNCGLCAEGSGCPEYRWPAKPAQPEQNGEETSTAKIKMVCIRRTSRANCVPCLEGGSCPGYCRRVKPVPEQSREVTSSHGKKENKLERTELVALLESLRKATEAIQKLLKVVDKQVEEEKVPTATMLIGDTDSKGPHLAEIMDRMVTEVFEKFLKAADKQAEDEKVSSAALPTENTTTGGPDLEAILGKERKTEDEGTQEIEDQSTEDELN
ncbi:hypothetical protein F5882DRAFT_512722 [Hyaloscypha sp. PMI_1271]|nr:hypothetical protein F5882DRAFT_512722 [Hyaloscypha sp. PMI_1271]